MFPPITLPQLRALRSWVVLVFVLWEITAVALLPLVESGWVGGYVWVMIFMAAAGVFVAIRMTITICRRTPKPAPRTIIQPSPVRRPLS